MNHELQRALEDAAWDGDTATVAALIHHPGVDPAGQRSAALLHAAHRGHWRCVELLLPVSNPNERNAEALWRAAKHRHVRVARLLAPVSDTSGWERWMCEGLPVPMIRILGECRQRVVDRTAVPHNVAGDETESGYEGHQAGPETPI